MGLAALQWLGFMNAGGRSDDLEDATDNSIDVSTEYDNTVPFPQYNKYLEYRAQVNAEKKLWNPVEWFYRQNTVIKIIIAVAIILLSLFLISVILKLVLGITMPWTAFL